MTGIKIIEKTKIWFSLSLVVILIGLVFLIKDGLNFGIDFKGGTEVVVEMGENFNKEEVDPTIKKYASDAITNVVNNTQLRIGSSKLTTSNTQKMVNELKTKYKLKDNALISQKTIGGSIGAEMSRKAIYAVVIANLLILLYIRFRFKDFKFGLAAIIALVHDILTTIALYAVLQVPVNSPFIAAMLTVVGYSISDTIVIFDRIRENLKKLRGKDIVEVANISINQTITRSLFTVSTVLVMTLSAHIFVPAVREYTEPLLMGVTSGAYSSIFIASPLWVIFKKRSMKKKNEKAA